MYLEGIPRKVVKSLMNGVKNRMTISNGYKLNIDKNAMNITETENALKYFGIFVGTVK